MKTSQSASGPQLDSEAIEQGNASTMPFAENRYSRFRFERESILENAPESSGVYGLYNAFWIYIGESDNLRASILDHLNSDHTCIARFRPSGFAFELASPTERGTRCAQLIKELGPFCNSRILRARGGGS
jgi:hypothetical protein